MIDLQLSLPKIHQNADNMQAYKPGGNRKTKNKKSPQSFAMYNYIIRDKIDIFFHKTKKECSCKEECLQNKKENGDKL